MHRSASVPPVAMSPRWYALPASMAHHCGPTLGRTVQPRPTRRNSRPASPGLDVHCGDIRSRAHPWERRATFAPMGRRRRRRSQDEYPRPTGRNSRVATPNWEHHRGESRSASPNREDHRGHRRSATHPWEHRRPRRHDLPCLNRPFNHRKAFTQPARSRRRICPHGSARAPPFPRRVPTPNWPKQQVSHAQLGTPSWRKPVSLAQS